LKPVRSNMSSTASLAGAVVAGMGLAAGIAAAGYAVGMAIRRDEYGPLKTTKARDISPERLRKDRIDSCESRPHRISDLADRIFERSIFLYPLLAFCESRMILEQGLSLSLNFVFSPHYLVHMHACLGCSSDTVNLRIERIRSCVAPVILSEEISVSDTAHVRMKLFVYSNARKFAL